MADKKPTVKKKRGKRAKSSDVKVLERRSFPLESLPLKYRVPFLVLILCMAICLLYPELVFQNKIFLARDVEAATSFAKSAHQVMIREHIYPLWNPFLFCGMPSYESLAYNPYVYPLSFVTGFLITKLHFPPNTWLLFHAFLLGLGVFLLLRDRGVSFIASCAAGVFMIWIPNLVAIGANGHGSQACAIAYIPYALLFWDRIVRGKGIFLNGSALIIVLGFQMLRAHLQISYYTYALIGLHMLFFSVLEAADAARKRKITDAARQPILVKRLDAAGGTLTWGLAAAEIGLLILIFLVVVGLSLLISSVLYFPVHEYSQYSIRGASASGGLDYGYATSWSLHPLEILTFLIPFSFGFGKSLYFGYMPFTDYPNYLGILIVAGAVAALFLARNRFVKFLVFIVIVSTLVAFGKYFPILYEPLFKWMPFFNKFRVPVMVLIVQQLSCILLFAYGLDALIKLESEKGRRFALKGLVVFAAILIVGLLSRGYWHGGFAEAVAGRVRANSDQQQLQLASLSGSLLYQDIVKFSLLGMAVFVSLFLYFKRVIAGSVFIVIILTMGLLDFYLVDRYITHPEKLLGNDEFRIIKSEKVIEDYLKPDPVIDFLKKDTGYYRILPFFHPSAPFYGDFTSNRYMNFGISSIGGYHAAKLNIYNEFLKQLGSSLASGRYQLLDMLNVRYIVATYPLPKLSVFHFVWQGDNWEGHKRYIYENLEAFPRVFLVDKYVIAKGDNALTRLQEKGLDLSSIVVLEKQPGIQPISRDGSEAKITKFGYNEIHIDAKIASPCIMVLSEIFYPRWKVTVDGVHEEILKADYILRALTLPPGNHSIVFQYDSSQIRNSFYVSLAAFIFVLIVLVSAAVTKGRHVWKRS